MTESAEPVHGDREVSRQLEDTRALLDAVCSEMQVLLTRVQNLEARLAGAASEGAPSQAAMPLFELRGETWQITWQGEHLSFPDSLGFRYLAHLVTNPHRPVHVLSLVALAQGQGDPVIDGGADTELSDPSARQAYAVQIEELRESIAVATSAGYAERACLLRDELAALERFAGGAEGAFGRARRFAGPAERARTAVQRRIRNASQRIGRAQPGLQRHLDRHVRTGLWCVYSPTPVQPQSAPPARA